MLGQILSWWSRQILDLVPTRFTRPDPSEAGALLVEPVSATALAPPGARLTLRARGAERVLANLGLSTDPLASEPAILEADRLGFTQAVRQARAAGAGHTGDLPVLVRLPAWSALTRDVTLPLAAEAGLDRVLAYEMDRLTPFSADETFYAYTVRSRDRVAQRLTLALSLVPRAPLTGLLALLSDAGAPAQAIEIAPATSDAPSLRIPLAHRMRATARREQLNLRAAAAGCAVLALVAIVLPFVLTAIERDRIEHRIAALGPQVRAAQALRTRITGGSAGALLVQAERAHLGDALAVMASLTRVLPDDSFLTDLSLRRGQLTVSGQSPSAARLIPTISADPTFTAPAFSAPVTRIEGQDADLFSIRAGVAQ